MSVVAIDATGCLVIDGKKVFPLGVSNPPPLGGKTPDGKDAWAEVASAGVNFGRSPSVGWSLPQVDAQLATMTTWLDAAAAHGLHGWLQLEDAANLPPSPSPSPSPSPQQQLLTQIATALKGHPGLGVYEGVDEPANPNRPTPVPAAGLVRAHQTLKAADPDHPVVIVQAPLRPGFRPDAVPPGLRPHRR